MGVPDEQITTQIDGEQFFPAKIAAMRAHATQIAVGGMFYALADMVGQKNFATEQYVLVRGERGARRRSGGPGGRPVLRGPRRRLTGRRAVGRSASIGRQSGVLAAPSG